MATSATFYLNASTFALATAAFADVNLTILAPDGFYSDGTGAVREQVLGTLGAITTCPSCVAKTIVYGTLYNWAAITDPRGITPIGWHIPDWLEAYTLDTYINGPVDGGQKLKSADPSFWTPSTGTDAYGFNFRGTGYRDNLGGFGGLNEIGNMWGSTTTTPTTGQGSSCEAATNVFNKWTGFNRLDGVPVRFLKDNSIDPGTVIDYDGNVYPTVTIGTQVWTAQNLIVEHYNNGDPIPNVTLDSDWASLTTGALCYYNNNVNNAYII